VRFYKEADNTGAHTGSLWSSTGTLLATGTSSAVSGGNGVYLYGSSPAFPTDTYNATNYWVDVVFTEP
jgi:hypothetical protein